MKRSVPTQNIPIRSELDKKLRHAFMGLKEHKLAEVDDDGISDRDFRRYRYVCWCGKTGTWQPSVVTALGDHDVHRSDMAEMEREPA